MNRVAKGAVALVSLGTAFALGANRGFDGGYQMAKAVDTLELLSAIVDDKDGVRMVRKTEAFLSGDNTHPLYGRLSVVDAFLARAEIKILSAISQIDLPLVSPKGQSGETQPNDAPSVCKPRGNVPAI